MLLTNGKDLSYSTCEVTSVVNKSCNDLVALSPILNKFKVISDDKVSASGLFLLNPLTLKMSPVTHFLHYKVQLKAVILFKK